MIIQRIRYVGKKYVANTSPNVKINGIYLCRDTREIVTRNLDLAIGRMDAHFKRWSQRSLSTLGKILIAKTFGISQVIYLLQTFDICDNDIKKINATLYKFIWNRNYHASKAPERIKREIINKPIKLGGFGMINIAELDASLKIRAIGRLTSSQHPYICLLKDRMNLTNFFSPVCQVSVDGVLTGGIKFLTVINYSF